MNTRELTELDGLIMKENTRQTLKLYELLVGLKYEGELGFRVNMKVEESCQYANGNSCSRLA